MTAKLTARDAVEYGPGWRIVEIDCAHGTTTSVYANGDAGAGAVQLTDADIVRATVAKHWYSERCRCTRRLRKRYGV